ncbi:MAG: hypothetical protein KC912_13565 [Proteobacteria bacterium]|nr:hypothetical protein [Pseudomonadota bacterium]
MMFLLALIAAASAQPPDVSPAPEILERQQSRCIRRLERMAADVDESTRSLCASPVVSHGSEALFLPDGFPALVVGELSADLEWPTFLEGSEFDGQAVPCDGVRPASLGRKLSATDAGRTPPDGAWMSFGHPNLRVWVEEPDGGWDDALGGEVILRGEVHSQVRRKGSVCRPIALRNTEIVETAP